MPGDLLRFDGRIPVSEMLGKTEEVDGVRIRKGPTYYPEAAIVTVNMGDFGSKKSAAETSLEPQGMAAPQVCVFLILK